MHTFNDAFIVRLLSLVPSTIGSRRAILEDIKELWENDRDEDL